jgi:TonB-dependent receptor
MIVDYLTGIFAGRCRCSFFLVLAFTVIPPAIAQQVGSVTGQIISTGDKASPLVGAFVRLEGSAIEAVSGAGGRFVLRNVPSGPQTLIISYMGLPSLQESLTVTAGDSIQRIIQLGAEPDAIEQVIVRGNATGRARALNMQRNAANVMDVVSADSIGNFPDLNVADALGRVPGISVVRNRGEGRYVTIRGIDAELNAYYVDGLSLAAPRSDARAVALDVIPADVVERLEVSKTLLPDQPADAIGGAVNVVSQSAFDYGEPIARFNMQSNYAESSSEWKPHFDAALGNVFGERGQLGVLVAYSQDEREFTTESQWTRLWDLEEDPVSGNENYLPRRIEQQQYDVERKRKGVTANLEFLADDDSLYFLRGIYSEFKDHGLRHRTRIELGAGGLESLDRNSAVVNIGDVEEFGETEITQRLRDRKLKLTVSGLSLGGENRLNGYQLSYQLGYSAAEEHQQNRLDSTYVLPDVTQLAYTGGTDLVQDVTYTGVGVDPRNSANYEFDEVSDQHYLIQESHWEMAFNARRDLATKNPGFMQAGVRARLKDKDSEHEESLSNANPASIDTLDQITSGNGSLPYQRSAPMIDTRILRVFNQQFDEFDMERDFVESMMGDWNSTEDVYATYMMAGYSFPRLSLRGGVRFEHTEFEARGNSLDADTESVSANSAGNNYNDWLPGLHAEYSFNDDWLLRAAYTKTLSRPGFEQSSASSLTDGDEIERGNPYLERALSHNYDLALELYLPDSLGLISVSGFYKDVEGFLFTHESTEELNDILYEVTSYENGDSGEMYGLEFAYQQELNFLPAPFDGFGIQGNVVFVDSEATLPLSEGRSTSGDRDIRFPRQSDMVGNLALTYEQGGLFLRVAASYQDEYLSSVGDTRAKDEIHEDYLQLDFSSRYSVNDQWTVFANFTNITDGEEGDRYRGSNRTAVYERYSWAAQVGVSFRL